jgi:hypothetical protein
MSKQRWLWISMLLACCGEARDEDVRITVDGGVSNVSNVTVTGNSGGEEPLRGDGQKVTELRELRGFSQIENQTLFAVEVTQADAFSVVLKVDSNLLPFLTTTVAGEELVLGWSHRGSLIATNPGVIEISLPRLTGLVAAGSGAVTYAGTADAIEVDARGSAPITLTGEAARAQLRVQGSGSLDASGFVVASGAVSTEGSGSLSATFTEQVSATVRGSGSIELAGGATISQRDEGSGVIVVR